MKKGYARRWAVGLLAGLAVAAYGEPPRLVNGKPLPGKLRGLKAGGLEIETPRGAALVTWEQLSPGTRYRYQPGFRDHAQAVLGGEPMPAGMAPDERILALLPGEPPGAPAAEDPAPDGAPAAPAEETKPEPAAAAADPGIQPSDFPAVELILPKAARYAAFRFGPGESQVLYLVMDPHSVSTEQTHEQLKIEQAYVYIPGNDAYGRPKKMRVEQDGARCRVRTIRFRQKEGAVEVDGQMDLTYATGSAHAFSVAASLRVASRGQSMRYVAKSVVRLSSRKGKVAQADLYGPPVMDLRAMDGGRRIVVNLYAGKDIGIVPAQAPETYITVEARDPGGAVKDTIKLRADKDEVGGRDIWEGILRRLQDGADYTLRASIDLSPLGRAEASSDITYRKLDL